MIMQKNKMNQTKKQVMEQAVKTKAVRILKELILRAATSNVALAATLQRKAKKEHPCERSRLVSTHSDEQPSSHRHFAQHLHWMTLVAVELNACRCSTTKSCSSASALILLRMDRRNLSRSATLNVSSSCSSIFFASSSRAPSTSYCSSSLMSCTKFSATSLAASSYS